MKVAITAKRAVMLVMTIGLAVAMVACQDAVPTKTPVTLGGDSLSDMSFTDFVAGTMPTQTVTITSGHFKGTNLDYKASSSKDSVATATVSGNVVTVTAEGVGTATVTVIATATAANEEGTQSLTFTVTVTAPVDPTPDPPPDNNAPRLKAGRTLPHHTDLMFGGSEVVDLSEYFTDDEGDEIMYAAESTNMEVVTTDVSGSMLTITVVNHGDATIRVTATDSHNESRREAFDVTVINQAPMIVGTEPTRFGPYLPEATQVVTLSRYFSDPEGDSLRYTAMSEMTAYVTVSAVGADSTVTITAVAVGTAMITITANDGNRTTSHELTVTVNAVPNEEPVVSMEIMDMTLDLMVMDMMESASETINLADHFEDPDDGPMPLSYSDDSDMTMIEGSMLTINADASDAGMMTTITVTATDGADNISDTFDVMVNAPDAPTRTSMRLGVQTLASDGDPMTITGIEGYFNSATSYEAWSDNTMKVTAEASESEEGTWTVTLTPVAAGEAQVVVTPSNSGGAGETLTFRVEVTGPAAVAAPTNPTQVPPQKVVLGTPKEIDISGHFMGATSYRASSGVAATVMAEVTDDGMLTLTPVAHGTAEVRVTAINSAGEVSDDFNVTVQAKPMFKEGKSLPALRINLTTGALDTPVAKALPDLSTLFEDPDGDDMSLKYSTKTSDVKKVYVMTNTAAAEANNHDTDAERDKLLMAEMKDVTLVGRAVGTATITVTVTDSDMLSIMETFVVTVVAASNAVPGIGTEAADAIDDLTEAARLKRNSEPKKVIDNKPINDYFSDTDLSTVAGDMLTFTVEYTTSASTAPAVDSEGVLTLLDTDKVAVDDRVASVELSTDMWDGDPFAGEDKFTVTVMPVKAGGPQRISIIATDLSGAKSVRNFEVQVNNPPVAKGAVLPAETATVKPGTLTELSKSYANLAMVTGFSTATGGATHEVTLVADASTGVSGGYFSDEDDLTAALNCRFNTRGDKIFATGFPAWADNAVRRQLNLATAAATAFAARGTAMIDVWCVDAAGESSPMDTLTIKVTSQGSIH